MLDTEVHFISTKGLQPLAFSAMAIGAKPLGERSWGRALVVPPLTRGPPNDVDAECCAARSS